MHFISPIVPATVELVGLTVQTSTPASTYQRAQPWHLSRHHTLQCKWHRSPYEVSLPRFYRTIAILAFSP